jgi:DivIVA domain-containing protein
MLAEWVETSRSTTRLQPGYDEEEVDAFLDEAGSRLAALPSARREAPVAYGAARPATGHKIRDTYLIASACLAGSLVSVGLAAAEWAEYARYNRVGNLALLGMVIGLLTLSAAAVVNDDMKPHRWAHRINTVAAALAVIGSVSLLILYGGTHAWMQGGG